MLFDFARSPVFRFLSRSSALAAGEDKKEQFIGIAKFVLLPLLAICLFVLLWSAAAKTIVSDSAKLPSPTETWQAGRELFAMHTAQRQADRQRKQDKLLEAVTLMAEASALDTLAADSSGELQQRYEKRAMGKKKRAVSAANFTPSSAPHVRRPDP